MNFLIFCLYMKQSIVSHQISVNYSNGTIKLENNVARRIGNIPQKYQIYSHPKHDNNWNKIRLSDLSKHFPF